MVHTVAAAAVPEELNFEWLAGVMAEFDRRAGAPIVDAAYVASTLERRIARKLDQLRVEESLRTVIIASPEAVPAAQPATISD